MSNQITFNVPSINSVLAKRIGIGVGVLLISWMAGSAFAGTLKASAISSGEQAVQTVRSSGEQQIAQLQTQLNEVEAKVNAEQAKLRKAKIEKLQAIATSVYQADLGDRLKKYQDYTHRTDTFTDYPTQLAEAQRLVADGEFLLRLHDEFCTNMHNQTVWMDSPSTFGFMTSQTGFQTQIANNASVKTQCNL
jgi:hypothetical protein